MTVTREHIRHSNLIENVKTKSAINDSMIAWEYLSCVDELSLDVVLETHRLVMCNIWPSIAGKLRTVNVTVGGRVCPYYDQVPALLNDYLNYMGHPELHDPTKLHVEFENIHPFRDGNGRVGRLIMWWHEIKCGMEPTLIKYEDRWTYYGWFE